MRHQHHLLRAVPIFILLSYRVNQKVTANQVQPIRRQIRVKPVYIHYADIRDCGYPQVMYILHQTETPRVR